MFHVTGKGHGFPNCWIKSSITVAYARVGDGIFVSYVLTNLCPLVLIITDLQVAYLLQHYNTWWWCFSTQEDSKDDLGQKSNRVSPQTPALTLSRLLLCCFLLLYVFPLFPFLLSSHFLEPNRPLLLVLQTGLPKKSEPIHTYYPLLALLFFL